MVAATGRRIARTSGVYEGKRSVVSIEPKARESSVPAHPSDEKLQERRGAERWDAEVVYSDAATAAQAADFAAIYGNFWRWFFERFLNNFYFWR